MKNRIAGAVIGIVLLMAVVDGPWRQNHLTNEVEIYTPDEDVLVDDPFPDFTEEDKPLDNYTLQLLSPQVNWLDPTKEELP